MMSAYIIDNIFGVFVGLAVAASIIEPVVEAQTFVPVVLDPKCDNLTAIGAGVIGTACADVTGDFLEVNVTLESQNCVITETHLCNVPTKSFTPETLTKEVLYAVDIETTYEFVCAGSGLDESYLVAGHASMECDDGLDDQPEDTFSAYYEFYLVCRLGGGDGAIIPNERSLDEMFRFSKLEFKNESLAMKYMYEGRVPLMSGNYPIDANDRLMLRDSYAISYRVGTQDFVRRYSTSPSDISEILAALELQDGPSHPEDAEFWPDFHYVVKAQLQRQECGDQKLASTVWDTPAIWSDATLNDAAEAVHDEYPGYWPAEHSKTLFGDLFPAFKDGYGLDYDVIPRRSRTEFLHGIIMLAEINNWAVSYVGTFNFGLKWMMGRARPEEIAWKIKQRQLELKDGVPQEVIDDIEKIENFGVQYNFTAYPEGSPAHPSWPAMHSAASACSLWMPVVMNMTDEQAEEVKRVDYAISYARTVAGVHYPSDNINGLNIGQEIVARELPAYLEQMYGCDQAAVKAKIAKVRFDWKTYDHTEGNTVEPTCT